MRILLLLLLAGCAAPEHAGDRMILDTWALLEPGMEARIQAAKPGVPTVTKYQCKGDPLKCEWLRIL